MKVLSLIIPTYNMEAFLGKCLNSVLLPQEQMNELEVIIVNDGSSDRSSEIAHKYAEEYPNTIVVLDKENGNYGSCINAALPLVKGKYVKVLDSDDTFDNANLSDYIQFLKGIDADLVLTDFIQVNEFDQILETHTFPLEACHIIDFQSFYKLYTEKVIVMHTVTYHRRVFSGLNYHQLEGVSYTDIQWVFEPMINVKSVVYFDKVIYRYLMGREGQTCSPSVNLKSVRQHIIVNQERMRFYAKNKDKVSSALKQYMAACLAAEYKRIYWMVLICKALPHMELLELDDFIKREPEVYNHALLHDAKFWPGSIFECNFICDWRCKKRNNWRIGLYHILRQGKLYLRRGLNLLLGR